MAGGQALGAGQDPYRILGISRAASQEEITSAYRRLVRRHHPDTASETGLPDQHRRQLQQIIAAHALLRDPERRAAYDRRHAPATPITGDRRPGSWLAASEVRPDAGAVYLGDRDGRGTAGEEMRTRRRIPIAHRGADTSAAATITAEQARNGAIITVATPNPPAGLRCTRIRIPPSIRDGQTLRVRGQGATGINGGPAGDLLLTLYIADHRTYAR